MQSTVGKRLERPTEYYEQDEQDGPKWVYRGKKLLRKKLWWST